MSLSLTLAALFPNRDKSRWARLIGAIQPRMRRLSLTNHLLDSFI